MRNRLSRRRAPNGKNRYLTKREEQLPRTSYGRGGNPTNGSANPER